MIVLAFPGCELNPSSKMDLKFIVDRIRDSLMQELETNISKSIRSNAKCIIPNDRISLMARLVCLSELFDLESERPSPISQKRFCQRSKIQEEIYNKKPAYAYLQIIHAMLSKWMNRFPVVYIDDLLKNLLNLDRNILKYVLFVYGGRTCRKFIQLTGACLQKFIHIFCCLYYISL